MVDPIALHGTRLREELGSVPQDLAPRRGTTPTWRRAGTAVPPCSAPRPAPPGRRASALPAAPRPAGGGAEPHRLRPPPFLWQPVRPAPTCPGAAVAMRAASGEQPAAAAEEADSPVRGEAAGGGQPWKKFVYVEPSRRVKEILEEELYFRKEACHVKHPAAVALEGIWSLKKNFSIGSLKPVSQNRNGLLLQPQLYSRHAGMKN
ncbi:uncharacterized protein C11orf97 homolog [Harpia harpyja]|uniref:uncharacterized protein C11orf97 homolog n=1 Tax=Harpia harpyja TaxID=202280 RepID=UPI0022B096C3|nr:uncharacterized protein C11orf97 homolog [Harpia harpyja]